MADFSSFLNHEKQILLDNIRRQRDIPPALRGNTSVARENERMIAVQKRYLGMLDTLVNGRSPDPETTLATCHEALRMAEQRHSHLILDGKANCEVCWETLDMIEFISELIRRIDAWRTRGYPDFTLEPLEHDEGEMH